MPISAPPSPGSKAPARTSSRSRRQRVNCRSWRPSARTILMPSAASPACIALRSSCPVVLSLHRAGLRAAIRKTGRGFQRHGRRSRPATALSPSSQRISIAPGPGIPALPIWPNSRRSCVTAAAIRRWSPAISTARHGPFSFRRVTAALGLARAPDIRSWPASRIAPPLLAIDHVFLGRRWTVDRIDRGPWLRSDHFPLLARLRLSSAQCAGSQGLTRDR
jgi:hypothetical protein